MKKTIINLEFKESILVKRLSNCARCGGIHTNVTFKQFSKPCDLYTHYAPCPTTHEPILLKKT